MKIAVKFIRDDDEMYNIIHVRKRRDMYRTTAILFHEGGQVMNSCHYDDYQNIKEAKKRAKKRARLSVKCRNGEVISWDKVPQNIQNRIDPFYNQISVEELTAILKDAHTERYVFFKDTMGIEDRFDIGIEYLGHATDDNDILKVYDKYGEICEVFKARLTTVIPTEMAVEVQQEHINTLLTKLEEEKEYDYDEHK